MTRGRVVDALARILDRRDRERPGPRLGRVAGRDTDGTLLVRPDDRECVARSCPSSAREGERIQTRPGACFTGQGGAALPFLSALGAPATVLVERLEPDELPRGSTLQVSVIGVGFSESTSFDFLAGASSEINEDVAILEQTLVNGQRIDLLLQVAGTAALGQGDLAFEGGFG